MEGEGYESWSELEMVRDGSARLREIWRRVRHGCFLSTTRMGEAGVAESLGWRDGCRGRTKEKKLLYEFDTDHYDDAMRCIICTGLVAVE